MIRFVRVAFLAALITASLAGCQSTAPAPVIVTSVPTQPSLPIASGTVTARPVHIALALGGGAARGFAHIGVIKALEARGIFPDIVVGTSAGSVVGALYASGYSGIEMNRLALAMDEAALSDWAMPSRGLFRGESLQDYVNKAVGQRPIEKLQRKFACTATDLHTGELKVFERGNVGQAVRASSAVPGLFQPVRIGDHEYVDGGLVSPIPVRVARALGADIVIAVDISVQPANADVSGMFSELLQAFAIMGHALGVYELKDADVVLRPELKGIAGSDFGARNSTVLAGEQAVSAATDRIKDAIEAKRRELND